MTSVADLATLSTGLLILRLVFGILMMATVPRSCSAGWAATG